MRLVGDIATLCQPPKGFKFQTLHGIRTRSPNRNSKRKKSKLIGFSVDLHRMLLEYSCNLQIPESFVHGNSSQSPSCLQRLRIDKVNLLPPLRLENTSADWLKAKA